jgi:Fungal protein kinase
MIAKNPREGDPKGFLIDLDLARLTDSTTNSGTLHRTGTMEFMAIEVLRREAAHTWRHDLESFFYLFIWICILYDGRGKPRYPQPTVLEPWSGALAATVKVSQTTSNDELEMQILDFFPKKFSGLKGLLKEWRNALFPLRDGGVFTGTHENHKPVYEEIIGIFEKRIEAMAHFEGRQAFCGGSKGDVDESGRKDLERSGRKMKSQKGCREGRLRLR